MTGARPALVPLREGDVPALAALSTVVGWNQTPADWHRLLRLAPGACLGLRDGGDLIGSVTLVSYGPVAWLGMVLVAPHARGAGHGKHLVEAALALAEAEPGRELRVVGLDATDMGEPIYVKHGFETVAAIDRWHGTIDQAPFPSGGPDLVQARPEDLEELASFDVAAAGADRRALLASLLDDPSVVGLVARNGERVVGYAFLRPGRTVQHLGPFVADGADARGALLHGAARAAGGAPVYLDVVRTPELTEWLQRAGLVVARRLKRMIKTLPGTPGSTVAELALVGPALVAAAALELG